MDFDGYQKRSRKTAKYPNLGNNFVYPTLGLTGEAGEVADKIKKHLRDDKIDTPAKLSLEQKMALSKELGDVLWYVSQLATECGLSLNDIAAENVLKLESRQERGKLGGSGDNR